MVDDAALIWRLRADEYALAEMAQALGWNRVHTPDEPADTQVAHYLALQKIHTEAWQIVFTTLAGSHEGATHGTVNPQLTEVKSECTARTLLANSQALSFSVLTLR
jgi:hypothetical protein